MILYRLRIVGNNYTLAKSRNAWSMLEAIMDLLRVQKKRTRLTRVRLVKS
jgi:hypothetical protein